MTDTGSDSRLRVIIAGGGVAALEGALALSELAPERTSVTVIAPNAELVNRPMTVREPFSYPQARSYPLAPIVRDAGGELVVDELAWVDTGKRLVHTKAEEEIEYDALLLAIGARARPRYTHALTIDDRHLDETLHGLLQDLEGGYIERLAFVAPGRMAWPLPLYELAMMTSARAYDTNIDLTSTIVTPEDSPLAIFGSAASAAVAERLERARIRTITSAYAEVPRTGEVVVHPGDISLGVDRVIALPELYGPCLRGIPLSEHGFIRITPYGQVLDARSRLRGRRCDGLRDQARWRRLPAGRRGGAVDRRARRSAGDPRAVPAGHPRHAAHRLRPDLHDRSDHGRAGVQLGGERQADVVAAEQDRHALSLPLPRSKRPRDGGRLLVSGPAAKHGRGRCLVLGYDGSESSRRAASWAVNELLPDGRLVLVHADKPPARAAVTALERRGARPGRARAVRRAASRRR